MAVRRKTYASIYDRVMAEMQLAEELGGLETSDSSYVQLMISIAMEAITRAEAAHRPLALVRYRN